MDEPVIQFNNFSFQYNAQSEPTLHGISFEVRKGEKLLIAGPSGCGKSTVTHCINGLIPFSYRGEITGSLKICGKETRDMGIFELSKIVGTVLQDSDGQFVGLTVAEDIAFALENDCVEGEALYSRVNDAADKVSISGHLHHAPTELSGGQKQRVSLAGVMVDNVDVLLFDEPLANLDPATGKQAIELIDQIQKDTGAAVIIVEHRLEDVLWRHVDRIILMDDGRILSDSSPDDLLSAGLLSANGIREPLYITALRYAGCDISPDMHPWSIREIELSDLFRERVKKWFVSANRPEEKKDRPVLFSARNIGFAYSNRHTALHNVSVDIRKGELVAVVGTNGAGKSTFAKIICGFETPQSGTLTFSGEDLSSFSIKERADRIGYVMQNPNQMISKVMIADEVGLGLMLRGLSDEEIKSKVDETLRICGLWEFRNWPISALSYGQKKRVTIASILALSPEMIILDEPTAGQDYRHYTDIMEFLGELNRRGITIVMITHDMHLMLEYAERAVVFHDGRIIADDACSAILTDSGIIEKANLKETSLYDLAVKCGIENGRDFVQRFIEYDREVSGR